MSKINHLRSALLLILSIIYTGLNAQTCSQTVCSCETDPSPAGLMMSHVHDKGETMVSVYYMGMFTNGIAEGNHSISKDQVLQQYIMSPESMQMNMYMLMGMYGINDKLTLMGMLNYNTMSMNMYMLPGSVHHHDPSAGPMDMNMKTNAIGDVKLYALYGPLNTEKHKLVFSLGVNLPTGDFKIIGATNSMYPSQRIPYAMQAGTGSFDFMPAVSYWYKNDRLNLGTGLSGVLRPFNNSVGYRYGHELNFNNWIAWQWNDHLTSSARIETSYIGAIQGYDPTLPAVNEPAADPQNYGGLKVNTYIGVNYFIKKSVFNKTKLGFEIGVPAFENFNGIQMKDLLTLICTAGIRF